MDKYHVEKQNSAWLVWRRCKDGSETLVATFHPQSIHKQDHRAEVMARRYCRQLNEVINEG